MMKVPEISQQALVMEIFELENRRVELKSQFRVVSEPTLRLKGFEMASAKKIKKNFEVFE